MEKQKFLILLHARDNEKAKALHALLYTQELKEAGYEVRLIFDGAGSVWADKFEDPGSDLHPLYKQVKALDVIGGVCEFCAGAFGVKEQIQQREIPLLGEIKGHPSLVDWVKEGYHPIVL